MAGKPIFALPLIQKIMSDHVEFLNKEASKFICPIHSKRPEPYMEAGNPHFSFCCESFKETVEPKLTAAFKDHVENEMRDIIMNMGFSLEE